MSAKHKMVMLVLSCDGYSDLWEDFFNLRDKYWADCPFKWYIVTESKDYVRNNVEVIKCGKDLNWSGRFRKAIKMIDADYYGIFLEDYFITEKIDTKLIEDLISVMEQNQVTFLNTADVFKNTIGMKTKEYFKEHLIVIPNNKPYGISTESGIWEHNYILNKLGEKDCSAWQFEIDRVNESKSPEGLGGFNLCDDRMPFHVSVEPVVIQGKIYPAARRYFKRQGYEFLTKRDNMTLKQVVLFNLKMHMSNIKYGRKIIKWFASKLLGVKFFT